MAALTVAVVAAAAWAIHARPAAFAHDSPIPPEEQRDQIALQVDLTPRIGCEEAFDLGLYEEPGVELVTWNRAASTRCRGRRAVVKYVPGRISRSALLERVARLSESMKVE